MKEVMYTQNISNHGIFPFFLIGGTSYDSKLKGRCIPAGCLITVPLFSSCPPGTSYFTLQFVDIIHSVTNIKNMFLKDAVKVRNGKLEEEWDQQKRVISL